jgi:predicted membrane-bound spermidine synthase
MARLESAGRPAGGTLDGLVRATALLLTMLTGFSGLVYEVAWQKYLATLLGSHSEATAAVLALFLGGLSAGYSLFGAVTRRVVRRAERRGEAPRLLLLYGVVEGSIGVSALLFPLLFRGVQALSLAIPHEAGGLGFALDVALSALLVLPPAVLMGGTIPILTQALSRSLADATRLHAHVYAFNTAGAFFGALAAGFVLIPWLGLTRVVLAMGVVNLLAGGTFLAIGLARNPIAVAAAGGDPDAPPPRLGTWALVALLVGFAAMGFQTVLIRVGGLSLGSSNYTFSMVVAVFVLCIAIGSFAVSALSHIPARLIVATQWLLAGLMALLYGQLNYAPYWAHVVRSWFRDVDTAFYPYYLIVFAASLAVLAVPIGLSGATLPLIFHHLKRQVGDLGAAAGKLYAWNTVGSLLGALLGGYLLLYWLDLDQVYLLALAAVVVAAVLLTAEILTLPRLAALVLLLVPALSGILALPRWEPNPLASAAFRMRAPKAEDGLGPKRFFRRAMGDTRITFYDDDPNSSVAVREPTAGPPNPAIITNGKPDGSIQLDYPTMALAALIPALFVERPEHGFVIGFGTGVTVGELAALRSMQKVTVAEISPGVIRAGARFEPHNQGALGNPKTNVVVSDAYRALLRSERQYDVIASEPSNPWVTGIEMLFSQEFLRAAKDRLRPGGVYAQWFHLYENDTSVVELVLRTYASVFDQVAVWYALGPDLILLGFKDPDLPRLLDTRRLRARFAQPDVAAGLRRAGIDSFPALLVHELLPLGVVHAAALADDVHTILHPVLSHRAGRAFFRGQLARIPPTYAPPAAEVGARNSLLRRFAAESGGRLDDGVHQQLTGEACKSQPFLCATLLGWWLAEIPESAARDAKHSSLLGVNPFRRHVAPPRIYALASLYGAAAEGDPLTPEDATRLSDLFAEYWFHGAPFPREVLAAAWLRCRDGGGARCRDALERAEQRLGPLRSQAGAPARTAPGAG